MADTKLTLYDMEIAIARSHEFNYIKNLVVFNVQGQSGILPLYHECDVLNRILDGNRNQEVIYRFCKRFQKTPQPLFKTHKELLLLYP